MGVQDEFTHRVRHEKARIAPHGDELANFGGGDFKLSDRVDVNTARAGLMQIADASGTAIDQQLAQRSHAWRPPARAMRHHQMGQLQQIPPLMPFWQAQEGIHAHDQAQETRRAEEGE